MLQCCSGCTCSRQPASRAAVTAPILPCPRSWLRVYLWSLSRVTCRLSASLSHVSRGCNVSGHAVVSSLRQSSARTERVSAAGACKRRCLASRYLHYLHYLHSPAGPRSALHRHVVQCVDISRYHGCVTRVNTGSRYANTIVLCPTLLEIQSLGKIIPEMITL